MMVSEEMKHLSSRERIMQCGQKWKFLTSEEKNEYQTEFLQMRDQYRSAMKNFLKVCVTVCARTGDLVLGVDALVQTQCQK